MTAYINKLKDKTGNQQLPATHERAVRDDNGTTLESKLQNLEGAMDKAYVASSDNGMGRITLKKNMVSGVNTLTQTMMQATNTIYVIQYDFTLGEDITVPANCVLEFDGGSISASGNNDSITGNNTGIQAGLVKIFNTNVILAGDWNVAEAYPEWFGAKHDGLTNDANAINKCMECFPNTYLVNTNYLVGTNDSDSIILELPVHHNLTGKNINAGYDLVSIKTNSTCKSVLRLNGRNKVENIRIEGNVTTFTDLTLSPSRSGICSGNANNDTVSSIELTRVFVKNFEIGFDLQSYFSVYKLCDALSCYIGFYIHGKMDGDTIVAETTSVTMENCFAHNTTYYGFKFVGTIYSSVMSTGADFCGYPPTTSIGNDSDLNKIKHAYYFYRCNSIACNSLGSEVCYKFIELQQSENMVFTSCFISLGYGYGDSRLVYVKPQEVIYSYYSRATFDRCVIRAFTPSIKLPENWDVTTENIKAAYIADSENGNEVKIQFIGVSHAPTRENILAMPNIISREARKTIFIQEDYDEYTNKENYEVTGEIALIDYINNTVKPKYHTNDVIYINSTDSTQWKTTTVNPAVSDLCGKTIIISNNSGNTKIIEQYGDLASVYKNGKIIFNNFRFNGRSAATKSFFVINNGTIEVNSCTFNGSILTSGNKIVNLENDSYLISNNSHFYYYPVADYKYTKLYIDVQPSDTECFVQGAIVNYGGILYIVDRFESSANMNISNISKNVASLPDFSSLSSTNKSRFIGCSFFYNGILNIWSGTAWVDATGTPV